MAEFPTKDAFTRCLGEIFLIHLGGDQPTKVDLELIEVTGIRAARSGLEGTGRPFSLVFRGPSAVGLSQRIYQMENQRLGLLEIFIVPIGSEPGGLLYQAIFN